MAGGAPGAELVAAKRKRARRRVKVKPYCRRPPLAKWVREFKKSKAMPF